MKAFNYEILEFFKPEEFVCPCCNSVKLEKEVLYKLFAMRIILQRGIIVPSGYRCEKYNETIPSAHPNSQHIYGQAADIYISGVAVERVVEVAGIVGFKRVYIMPDKGSVHCGL